MTFVARAGSAQQIAGGATVQFTVPAIEDASNPSLSHRAIDPYCFVVAADPTALAALSPFADLPIMVAVFDAAPSLVTSLPIDLIHGTVIPVPGNSFQLSFYNDLAGVVGIIVQWGRVI